MRQIERNTLIKHIDKFHPLIWLQRAEACGLVWWGEARACRVPPLGTWRIRELQRLVLERQKRIDFAPP